MITRAHARGGRATGGPSRFLTEAGLLDRPGGAGRLTRTLDSEGAPCTTTTPATAPRARAARPHPPGGGRAVPAAVRARRDRLPRHDQGPLPRPAVRRRAGRRLPERPVGPAPPERGRARPLAPPVRRRCPPSSRRSRRRPRARRLYLACRLIVTLPLRDGGPDVEAVYEDIGELDAGSLAGLKALYSDARKRAAVAAGIGAYLYTALAPVVLPIGPGARQVQAIRRAGKSDLLVLSAETEQWLRDGYRARMSSRRPSLRDLGPILAHGEPDDGMGQGESTDQAAHATEPAATDSAPPDEAATPARPVAPDETGNGSGELVTVDFGALGPDVPPAA